METEKENDIVKLMDKEMKRHKQIKLSSPGFMQEGSKILSGLCHLRNCKNTGVQMQNCDLSLSHRVKSAYYFEINN